MPPRKKIKPSAASAKKCTQQSQHSQQPSKYGIQHFFHRHAAASQNALSTPQSPISPSPNLGAARPSNSALPDFSSTNSNVVVINVDGDQHVSPEVSKSLSLQRRFNFSPGMLIKQSQDDGGEDVTWKISPVNERLQSFSKRAPPEVFKALSRSSTHSSSSNLSVRPCSQNKAQQTSLLPAGQVALARADPVQDRAAVNGSSADVNCSLGSRQSPFRTPPSLSYCHERLVSDMDCNGMSNQMGLGQHKKALLELLDQVEDAISVEDLVPGEINAYSSLVEDTKGNKILLEVDPEVKASPKVSLENIAEQSLNHSFLVLEVAEKHKPAHSSVSEGLYKVLRLLNEKYGEERSVYLWHEWFYSVIAPGDTVHVLGEFDEQGKCDVDRDNNLLIVHPDILVSGTRVAASFNCARRSVLDERLKCSEHSVASLIGTLLHQIFQAGLLKDKPTIDFLEEHARVVLQKNIEGLFACQVDQNDILKTLVEAVPKILNWIMQFKNKQDSNASTVDFGSDSVKKMVTVTEVIDIEEMAWAPKYGLKGMIDATLQVKLESSRNVVKEKILPLEFKTGKLLNGQSSLEHCAQVILYTLLMSERYLKDIDSGLLYYLQSNKTQGITVRRSDVVGLIMRRNELANDILKASICQQLPPMLQRPSMCKGCRHLGVCTIYHKVHGGSTESSGLGELFDMHVQHLTTAHSLFLQHWDRLIDLEARETQLVKNEIWRSHSMKGGRLGSCLSSIVLDTSTEPPHEKSRRDNCYIYRFVRRKLPSQRVYAYNGDSSSDSSSLSPTDDMDFALKSGDYVILSTESARQAIASGVIADISRKHVSVSFSKRLRLPSSNSSAAKDLLQEVWRIDKDEVMTAFSIMRFNLVQLFLPNERSSHIRKMIVDLEAPRFDGGRIFSQDPAISYILSVKTLNGDQRRAILKILTAKDYALILGMPGTGKTSTMVHAVKALLMRGASVLLASYTNSAVDNLLIKLKNQGIDFLRIGRREAVHEEVQDSCFSAMDIQSVDEIRLRLCQVKVVAVTCLGISSALLANMKFDVCIMDEAGQITLPISLGPLMLTSMFVLVGDHYQLPPLVQSTEARENGMGVSLFCRLSEAHPQAVSALQSQYRMCQGIMEISNALVYGDRLHCGSPEIANAKLKILAAKSCSSWLKEVLNPNKPVILVNTDVLPALEVKDSKAVNNPIEAYIISEITKHLVNGGIEGTDIGIITPYNSQANLIRTAVHVMSVEIHTIDKYQGRDKDCILLSFVRSSENPRGCSASLLGDWHRINVALTRAKKKLIMVGSCRTLSKVPLLKLLVEKVEEQWGILNVSKEDINYKGHGGELRRCSQIK